MARTKPTFMEGEVSLLVHYARIKNPRLIYAFLDHQPSGEDGIVLEKR